MLVITLYTLAKAAMVVRAGAFVYKMISFTKQQIQLNQQTQEFLLNHPEYYLGE